MKKIKIILIFIINLLIIINSNYSFAEDIQITTTAAPGSNGSIVTIDYTVVPGTGAGNLLIDTSILSLESSGSINPNTTCLESAFTMNNFDSFQITDIENVNNTGGPVCDYFIDFTLPDSINDGDYIISHSLYNTVNNTSTSLENTVITVVNANKVTSAETVDSNSNGFIDTLKLFFTRSGLDENSFSNIGLRIGTITNISLGSVIDNIVLLNFNDGIYDTGFIPQLVHTGAIFDGIDTIEPIDVEEVDKAKPIVYKINGQDPSGAISISENSKLSIQFSENMYIPSIVNSFQIIENGNPITNTGYIVGEDNTLTYCKGGYDGNGDCNVFFDTNSTYTIKVGSGMIDNNSNQYTGGDLEINITVQDITPPVSSSITYNSETNNGIVINGNSGNNSYTNNSSGIVNLSVLATDNSNVVSKMCISEDNSLTNDNICDTSWKTYSVSDSFTFTGSEGLKTLYIKFKDVAGNVSTIYSDSITWDKTPPETTSNPSSGYYQNGANFDISLSCIDTKTSCNETYYTFDNWINTITYNNSTGIQNVSGSGETITLKYYSEDIASNQEGITNTQNYIFSNSYISFNNNESITSNTGITLSGSCNESTSNETTMEYSLDNWSTSTDLNCNSNQWNFNETLNQNILTDINIRFKTHTGITSNYTITHDNISPNLLNLIINNGDTYSNSRNVNLSISGNDVNGISKMMISEDNSFSGAVWNNYSNTKSFELTDIDSTKTIYIKVKDEAGNISTISNDTIILETTVPILSSDLSTGTYSSSRTVTLSSSDNVYYTLDNSTPTNSSTLYNSGLLLGESTGIVNLKAIAYGISGLNSGIKSYTYDFKCISVSNGTVTNYPTCTLTCNSGYTKSGNSCLAPVSSGGGGGGGGGGISTQDYEAENSIDKSILELEEKITNLYKKYGILDISNLSSRLVTGNNGIIDLRIGLKAYSKLIIGDNTTLLGDANKIYAPYTIDIVRTLKIKTLKILNNDFKAYNIKALFFAGNKDELVTFNKDIELNFNLGDPIEGNIFVFYSEKSDGNFSLLKSGLKTDENGIISFKTNKLGYFAVIRDIYIEKYYPNFNNQDKTSTISDKTGNIESPKNINEELKSQITNINLNPIIDKFYKKILIPEIDYYISFDKDLESEYNNVVNGYKDFVLNIDKYLTTKELSYRSEAGKGYIQYLKVSNLKNFEEKYISKTNNNGKEIYKTKYIPIQSIVNALESKMLTKLNKLLDSNTITKEKYNSTIKDYNQFILHLSIYKQYNNKTAALKALTPGKRFLAVYKMDIKNNKSSIIEKSNETQLKPIKIKDKYTFTKELKFGDYNEEVRNLQEIMKSYGYFTYPQTTMYFGSVTQNSFINFSKEVLNIQNDNGILTQEGINILYTLEYKE